MAVREEARVEVICWRRWPGRDGGEITSEKLAELILSGTNAMLRKSAKRDKFRGNFHFLR